MQRDLSVDVLKGLAITTVVMGHIEGFPFTLVPVYSFHMPLFFFLSGLFYSETSAKDIFTAIGGVIKNLALPTLAVVLFYSAVQAALNHFNIMHDDPSLSGVFRFGTKLLDTYWYIGCYFCVYLYFYIIHRPLAARLRDRTGCRVITLAAGSLWVYFLVSAACLSLAVSFFEGFPVNDKWAAVAAHEDAILALRVGFGIFFYYLGSVFALLMRERRRPFSTLQLTAALLIGLAVCRACFYLTDDQPEFSMQIMYFPSLYTPFFSSLGGIAMLYGLAGLITRLRFPAGVLAVLGRRSFSIMSHHIFSFLLLNILFLHLGLVADRSLLDDPYFKWRQEDTYLLYLAVGLAYPVFFSWLLGLLGGNLGRRLRAETTADGGF